MTNLHINIPPIKSQGIKTKLIPWIRNLLPVGSSQIWVEPFMGTGAVGFNLACASAYMCDTSPHIINFYNSILSREITPGKVRLFLQNEGEKLKSKGEEHYYFIRERFNKDKNPIDFLFLNRACFNGMIRFNKKGEFNVPFCRKPERFAPAYITKIVNQVEYLSQLFQYRKFEFHCQDFATTIAQTSKDSIIYCDPPYIDRHADYYNGWAETDEKNLFLALSGVDCNFILSTWHHNDFRDNQYIEKFWNKFNIYTRDHFYHLGAKEENRRPMVEALVTNYTPAEVQFRDDTAEKWEETTLITLV